MAFVYQHHDDGDITTVGGGIQDKAEKEITAETNTPLDRYLSNLSKGYLFSLDDVRHEGKVHGLEDSKIDDLIISALSQYGLEKVYNEALSRVRSLGEDEGFVTQIGQYLNYQKEKIEADLALVHKEYTQNRFSGRLTSLATGHIIDLSDAWKQGKILGLEDSKIKSLVIDALSKHGLEKAYGEALGYVKNYRDNRYDYVVKEIGSYLNYQTEKIESDLNVAYSDNVRVRYNEALTKLSEGYLFYKDSGTEAGKELNIPDDQLHNEIALAYKAGLPKAYKLQLSHLEEGTSGQVVKFGFLYELHEHVNLVIAGIKQLGKELGYDETRVQQDIDSVDKNKDKRRNATKEEKEEWGL